MNQPLVSLNLLLHKPGFYLKPCLESLLKQSYRNFELLIIDNNSADGTPQEVKEIMTTEVSGIKWRLIVNEKNLGFAAAHNQGIKESRGELVVLVNQDIILDKDFLENIIEIFKDEKTGSAQGKLWRLRMDGENLSKTETIDNTGLVMLKNRRIIARGQGQKDEGQFDKTEAIFGVDGALPVYRRAALEDVKIPNSQFPIPNYEYLDEDFFAYKEDVDLAWRLRLYGWQAFYVPPAAAWHARSAGDSAATNYLGIIKERLRIGKFAKYLSFKNQRLMQIKNEQPTILLKHLLWWLPKEIASWIYVILFEHYTWRAIRDLFRQAPGAWQKRKIIMARRRVSSGEMERWFK
ncbi:MAG: Glycosyl transferase, family 2 [Parcubacteria group bacterium LiPW_39]|nr:MAG: Glycosyl transferase, family 2 [Parcubacteria group bacterium LiPW_39]